jgi:nicotinamidase-related amidase
VAQARSVVPKIRMVLDAFRERKMPIFHILRVHRRDGSDIEIIRQDLFRMNPFAVAGTKGAAIIDELQPLQGEYIITKTRMSAFIATNLDLMLRTLGITDLVVTGIQTPNCIRTTVFDAIAYNYPVILVADAVGAKSDEVHNANVADMANIGVKVMNAQDLVAVI